MYRKPQPRTIWKFEVKVDDEVKIEMPSHAEVLSVGSQKRGHLCFWAIVDPDNPKVYRNFSVRGTGHPLDLDPLELDHEPFIATVIDGEFVWHIFGRKT